MGMPWMLGRPGWFALCALPGRGCSSRSPRPAPGRPPRCPPWLGHGPTAAARCSGWPRRPPRRRNFATPLAYRPTRWPKPEPLTGPPTHNDGGMFRPDPLPKLSLICIKAHFARRSSSPRAVPRPSRPTERHQTRTEVETPGRPARPTRRPQISSDQDQPQEEGNRHPLGLPSASARLFPAWCPPRSSLTAAKPIPTARFDPERLAARVDRPSGCRFQLVLAEQTRGAGMLAVLLTVRQL